MEKIRPEGIPNWVTILAILIGLVPTGVAIAVSLNHSFAPGFIEGADGLTITWAGRTLGLGLATLLAVYLRNANAYAVVFLGAIIRELSDIWFAIAGGLYGLAIGITILLLIEVAAFIVSLRTALRKNSTT